MAGGTIRPVCEYCFGIGYIHTFVSSGSAATDAANDYQIGVMACPCCRGSAAEFIKKQIPHPSPSKDGG